MNKFKKFFDNDDYQIGLRTVIICTLAVLLTVGINMLSGMIPTKIGNVDVSTEKVYSISTDTENAIEALAKDVTVYYVCEAGKEYHNTEVMLNLFADAGKHVTVQKVDPAFEPDLVTRYMQGKSLENNSLIVVSGDRRQLIQYSDYYSGGSFVLEDVLSSAISYVTSDKLQIVYALTGHDEQEIHSSTEAYMGLDGFEVQTLNLMEEGRVPEDGNVVIINGIKKDITAKEADCLLAYLKAGGKLLLVTDYGTSTMKNLERVTSYFGASLGEGLIMETDSSRYTDDNPAYIYPTIYGGDYTITRGINYLLLPNLKPIVIDDEMTDVKVETLLETSEASCAVVSNIFTNKTTSEDGPFTVGATFEKGEDGQDGKMIWVTSKYVSDVTVSESVGGGNITFFLNSVCWLADGQKDVSVHSKKISNQYLTVSDAQVAIWQFVLIGCVPLSVLVVGAFVCIRRKKRK